MGNKMKEEDREKIEEILGRMRCPKDFKCVDSRFEDLCKAKDFGADEQLLCLEQESALCPFAVECDLSIRIRFCRCPLRVYLAKNLNKQS